MLLRMLGAIVTGAGSGERFGGEKILAPLLGEPLLYHTLRRLRRVPELAEVVLVLPPDRVEAIREGHGRALEDLGVRSIIAGGETRQQSVRFGLDALPPEIDLVLVHDAVRPVFSVDAATAAVEAARRGGAAIVAVPARDTLKRVDVELSVTETVPRGDVWHAETPQVARRDLLEDAYRAAGADGFVATDEASLMEHLGRPVTVVRGGAFNVKVTERGDLRVVEALLAAEELT